jgi:hypothetical protein
MLISTRASMRKLGVWVGLLYISSSVASVCAIAEARQQISEEQARTLVESVVGTASTRVSVGASPNNSSHEGASQNFYSFEVIGTTPIPGGGARVAGYGVNRCVMSGNRIRVACLARGGNQQQCVRDGLTSGRHRDSQVIRCAIGSAGMADHGASVEKSVERLPPAARSLARMGDSAPPIHGHGLPHESLR